MSTTPTQSVAMPTATPTATSAGTALTKPVRPYLEPQSEAWRARCVALAVASGRVGLARCVGITAAGDTVYHVPSKSERGQLHRIHCRAHGELVCDCTAGGYGNPCGHAGACIVLQELVREAAPPALAEMADRDYAMWFDWLIGSQRDEVVRE